MFASGSETTTEAQADHETGGASRHGAVEKSQTDGDNHCKADVFNDMKAEAPAPETFGRRTVPALLPLASACLPVGRPELREQPSVRSRSNSSGPKR